jgi:putative FmdB family regulatory protein
MPIYEFYCPKCNVLFNFFAKAVNTTGRPDCPKCEGKRLTRQISMFAAVGRAKEDTGDGKADDDLPIDDAKMERAMESLAGEAEGLDENDPRQAARLMRKFSDMTGLEFKENMKSAIERMEAGEDPEAIEQEMGGMEDEDPFVMPGKKEKVKVAARRRPPPRRDPKLYEM